MTDCFFLGFQSHCKQWLQPWKKRYLLFGRKAVTNLDSILKSRNIPLLAKVCLVKAMFFSGSYVQIWELYHKEGFTPKWCFWIVVLEKNLESPLDCREIKLVSPKVNQPWNINWKPWCWNWSSSNSATRCEEATHWKTFPCWKRLKAKGEEGGRGWDG